MSLSVAVETFISAYRARYRRVDGDINRNAPMREHVAALNEALLDAARSEPHDPSSLQKMQTTPQAVGGGETLTIADYEEVLADHRKLVKELDVLLNGEGGAERPSLCDIVGQLRHAPPSPSYDPTKSLGGRLCEAWQAALPPSGWVDKVEWSDFGPDQQGQWERAALNFTARLSDAGER